MWKLFQLHSCTWYLHQETLKKNAASVPVGCIFLKSGTCMEKTALGEWLCLILLLHMAEKGIKKKDGSELKLVTWKLILWAAICFLVTLLRSSKLRGISGSWDSYNQVYGLKILGCMNMYFEGYSQTAWMITFLSLWAVDVEVCLKKQPCRSSGILLCQVMSIWDGDGHPQGQVWLSLWLSCSVWMWSKSEWDTYLPVFLLL